MPASVPPEEAEQRVWFQELMEERQAQIEEEQIKALEEERRREEKPPGEDGFGRRWVKWKNPPGATNALGDPLPPVQWRLMTEAQILSEGEFPFQGIEHGSTDAIGGLPLADLGQGLGTHRFASDYAEVNPEPVRSRPDREPALRFGSVDAPIPPGSVQNLAYYQPSRLSRERTTVRRSPNDVLVLMGRR